MSRKLFLIFLLSIAAMLWGEERVRLEFFLDTNRYVTQTGDTISLANVETVSIFHPDSLEQLFALKTFKFVKKHLAGSDIIIQKQESDAGLLVHAWKEKLVGRESVNALILKKGYGRFVASPANEFCKNYQAASDFAKSRHLGLHQPPKRRLPVPQDTEAFWVQAGLGMGQYFIGDYDHGYETLYLDIGAVYRYHRLVVLGGFQGIGLGECGYMTGPYVQAGRAFVAHFSELSITGGLGLPFDRYTCSDISLESNRVPALMMKTQFFLHAPKHVGLGVGFDISLNRNASYFTFSLLIGIGQWNY